MLLIDSAAVLVLVYWSLHNDRLPPGKPERGWFRMVDPELKPQEQPKTGRERQARRRERSRL